MTALRPQPADAYDCRVCDLAEAFLELILTKSYSDSTYRRDCFYLMSFCNFAGYRPAHEIILNHVSNWLIAPCGAAPAH